MRPFAGSQCLGQLNEVLPQMSYRARERTERKLTLAEGLRNRARSVDVPYFAGSYG